MEKKREAFLEIKEYKDKGIPVVGMYCAYFPTELAMAVGAIPVGLCSFSNETITAAERDLPKSMCPLVKSSYGFAISDRCPFFHFADLVIGETTCDEKEDVRADVGIQASSCNGTSEQSIRKRTCFLEK